jgi:hypothetical protein
VAMLIEHAERHSLEVWQIWGRCWKGVLLIRRGDIVGLFASPIRSRRASEDRLRLTLYRISRCARRSLGRCRTSG